MEEKTLHNSDVSGARQNVKDIQVVGNGDMFRLLCKASSQAQGWMKSTKAMEVPGGCVVQVTTQQRNPDGSYAVAEALTYVPGVQIVNDVDNRVRANAYFQQIRVTRTLEVIIESSYERQVKKVLGLFAVKGDPLRSYTRFHGRVIRILTEPELSLTVAGQSVAETPIQFRLVPDALKLITRRGTLLE
jgi:hypothetical protein